MYWILFFIGLFLCVALEATGISLPWVFVLLLLVAVMSKKEWLFLVGIAVGICLDSVTFRPVGESSLFFVCLLGLIFLYERKFEMQSIGFVAGMAAVGSLVYSICFMSSHIVLETLLATAISCIAFFGLSTFLVKPEKW